MSSIEQRLVCRNIFDLKICHLQLATRATRRQNTHICASLSGRNHMLLYVSERQTRVHRTPRTAQQKCAEIARSPVITCNMQNHTLECLHGNANCTVALSHIYVGRRQRCGKRRNLMHVCGGEVAARMPKTFTANPCTHTVYYFFTCLAFRASPTLPTKTHAPQNIIMM